MQCTAAPWSALQYTAYVSAAPMQSCTFLSGQRETWEIFFGRPAEFLEDHLLLIYRLWQNHENKSYNFFKIKQNTVVDFQKKIAQIYLKNKIMYFLLWCNYKDSGRIYGRHRCIPGYGKKRNFCITIWNIPRTSGIKSTHVWRSYLICSWSLP